MPKKTAGTPTKMAVVNPLQSADSDEDDGEVSFRVRARSFSPPALARASHGQPRAY